MNAYRCLRSLHSFANAALCVCCRYHQYEYCAYIRLNKDPTAV